MNGNNVIEEVRGLVGDESLDTEAVQKITLAAVVDMLENQQELDEKQEARAEEDKILHEKITQDILELKESILERMDKRDKEVHDNPMMKVGKFIQEKPKPSLWILFGFIFLSNLWMMDVLRQSLLSLLIPLGYPKEWVF